MKKGLPLLLKMEKTYERAIELLFSKGRQERPTNTLTTHLEGLSESKSSETSNVRAIVKGKPSIYGMKEWLGELGHSPADIDTLSIIHVAGTKGKGSTCTFITSLLASYGARTGFPQKIGLYTSPHLIHTEERFRINSVPISRSLFAKYLFEIEDLLSPNGSNPVAGNGKERFHLRPRRMQFLTLLAFHIFLREKVDVAVVETHHGGEYDSTNVVEKPAITAITSLGIDHIGSLGNTIETIAWHKAGIFKEGVVAVSAPQDEGAAAALLKRASEKDVELRFVDPATEIGAWDLPADSIQLRPDVQKINASVALAATRAWLKIKGQVEGGGGDKERLSREDVLNGIKNFNWPGRFQFESEENGKNQWFLDGAHNEMSVGRAGEWFIETADIKRISETQKRILVYSSITDQRDAVAVFRELTKALEGSDVKHVIFTTYDFGSNTTKLDMKQPSGVDQHDTFSEIWKEAQPSSEVFFEPTIKEALEKVRSVGEENGNGMQVLVTGSLHLVGGCLALDLGRRND